MSGNDWYVPGPFIQLQDGEHKIRLYPPSNWRRDIIEIKRTPPSMNTNQIRSNWRGFHAEKKDWQEEIGRLLLLAQLPRRNERAVAGAFLRFQKPVARRDEGNYAQLLNKALGDALVIDPDMPVTMRFIPDDHTPYYVFGGVEFEEELGPPRTLIYLYTQPRQEE